MPLYTEVVMRTFTGGLLDGISVEQRIPHISNPRPIGSVQRVLSLYTSSYLDEVVDIIEEVRG